MTEKEIRSKIGVPWQVSNEKRLRMLDYNTKGNDGIVRFEFLKGRLVKVVPAYTPC
jgi:hypothetical protein